MSKSVKYIMKYTFWVMFSSMTLSNALLASILDNNNNNEEQNIVVDNNFVAEERTLHHWKWK